MIALLVLTAFAASAKDSDWVGIYTFDEESWDESRERISYWFRIEIRETDAGLAGVYAEGINGEATRRFEISVKTTDDNARIFFERSLPRVEGAAETCSESEFLTGDLLFEFDATTIRDEPAVYTVWRKMNLAVRTETGGAGGEPNVFFRKSYIKKHPAGFIK